MAPTIRYGYDRSGTGLRPFDLPLAGRLCANTGHSRPAAEGHRLDNIPDGALHRPALTTVAVAAGDREEAARLLLRGVKSPEGPPESIILPPKVVIR